MSAGALDNWLDIDRHGTGRASDGQATGPWVPLDGCWGRVTPVTRPDESVSEGRDVSTVRYIVKMYYRDDVTNDCRITTDGMALDVLASYRSKADKSMLECDCERRT